MQCYATVRLFVILRSLSACTTVGYMYGDMQNTNINDDALHFWTPLAMGLTLHLSLDTS